MFFSFFAFFKFLLLDGDTELLESDALDEMERFFLSEFLGKRFLFGGDSIRFRERDFFFISIDLKNEFH